MAGSTLVSPIASHIYFEIRPLSLLLLKLELPPIWCRRLFFFCYTFFVVVASSSFVDAFAWQMPDSFGKAIANMLGIVCILIVVQWKWVVSLANIICTLFIQILKKESNFLIAAGVAICVDQGLWTLHMPNLGGSWIFIPLVMIMMGCFLMLMTNNTLSKWNWNKFTSPHLHLGVLCLGYTTTGVTCMDCICRGVRFYCQKDGTWLSCWFSRLHYLQGQQHIDKHCHWEILIQDLLLDQMQSWCMALSFLAHDVYSDKRSNKHVQSVQSTNSYMLLPTECEYSSRLSLQNEDTQRLFKLSMQFMHILDFTWDELKTNIFVLRGAESQDSLLFLACPKKTTLSVDSIYGHSEYYYIW